MNRSRRKSTMTAYIAGLLALLLLSAPPGALAQPGAHPPLFAPTTVTGDLGMAADPTIVRSRLVAINLHLLAQADGSPRQWAPGGALKLNLFDDVSFTALFDRVELNAPNSFAWIGRIDGIDLSQVILVVRDQIMMGTISMPGALYQVRYAGKGLHAVHELNPGVFPPERPPLPVDPAGLDTSAPAAADAIPDDGSLIDVLVVYTVAAATAAGGTTAMNTLIDLAKTETNTSYANSGITQRIRIVHTAEVSYTESGDIYTDLNNLTNTSDGFMDNVHTLRNTYAADLITLLVENGGGFCGIGRLMTSVTPSFASNGFNVVARNCATGNYSFGHELGHNMSARHDWYQDPVNNSPYTYNHGHVNVSGRWRTIMSYNNQCAASGVSCTRIPYWSNPDILYGGTATGVPEGSFQAADNRKTLNNTAFTVANFRAGVTPPTPSYTEIPGGGLTPSSPAAVLEGSTLHLFVRGINSHLYVNSRIGGTFSGWSEIPGGGFTPNQPAAVLDSGGSLRLYVQGADNGLWVNTKSGSTWSGWSAVPGGGSLDGPTAFLDGSAVRLVVRGLDDGIWTALADNPQWTSLGGRTFHSPAAVMEGSTLHVFVRGTDGALYLNSRSGGSFGGWSAVPGGGQSSSQPAALLDGSSALRLYVQGADNGLWVNVRSGGTWSGWSAVPGGGLTPSGPTAVLDGSTVRLVVRGIDDHLYTTTP